MTPSERFWSKVDKSGECWVWTASRFGEGKRYGQFRYGERMKPAHRVAWALAHGGVLPPPATVVCHACDNPLCVRVTHLFLGTQADNMRDMWAKGRGTDGANAERGEKRYNAKLDPAKVREIRELAASGVPETAIAERFGICKSNARRVAKRQAWKHVA